MAAEHQPPPARLGERGSHRARRILFHGPGRGAGGAGGETHRLHRHRARHRRAVQHAGHHRGRTAPAPDGRRGPPVLEQGLRELRGPGPRHPGPGHGIRLRCHRGEESPRLRGVVVRPGRPRRQGPGVLLLENGHPVGRHPRLPQGPVAGQLHDPALGRTHGPAGTQYRRPGESPPGSARRRRRQVAGVRSAAGTRHASPPANPQVQRRERRPPGVPGRAAASRRDAGGSS